MAIDAGGHTVTGSCVAAIDAGGHGGNATLGRSDLLQSVTGSGYWDPPTTPRNRTKHGGGVPINFGFLFDSGCTPNYPQIRNKATKQYLTDHIEETHHDLSPIRLPRGLGRLFVFAH